MRMKTGVVLTGVMLLFILGAGATAFVPMLTQSFYAPSDSAQPYTELEARGRKIYVREGCWYCHTQYVRPVPADQNQNLGRPSEPGDYVYDKPHLLGSERTGPDLMWVGDRPLNREWHIAHLRDPQGVRPSSVMPSFAHLPDDELEALTAYLLSLKGGELAAAPTTSAAGKDIFAQNCAGCHGANAEGGFGPALKDNAFIQGLDEAGLVEFLKAGRPDKGMPSWASLGDETLAIIATYLHGLNPGMKEGVVAPATPAATPPPAAPPPPLASGADAFAQNCAACHGTNGEGGIGPALKDNAFIQELDEAGLVEFLKGGRPDKGMPAWRHLGDETLAAIAAHLLSWQGAAEPATPSTPLKTEPRASPAATTIPGPARPPVEGEAVFAQNCASCHGANAEGGFGPALRDNTFIRGKEEAGLVEFLKAGRPDKGMPPWAGLGEDKLKALGAFLRALQL